jgi:hypothetical protein
VFAVLALGSMAPSSLTSFSATAAKLVPAKILAKTAETNFAERFDMAIPE